MTPQQLIIKTLSKALSYATTDYRNAACEYAAQKARRDMYEQVRDPMDGVGGFTKPPYPIEAYQQVEQDKKAAFDAMREAYELAVETFLLEKEKVI